MICGAPLLLSLGIIQGYSDGTFQPNRDITQAQFAVIAIRFANETPGGTSLFSDANEDDWFYTQVTSAAQYGWIGGFSDGTFRPYILMNCGGSPMWKGPIGPTYGGHQRSQL